MSRRVHHKIPSQSWSQTLPIHHVLLAIIVLQVCFMLFMSFEGPTGMQSHAKVDPHKARLVSRSTIKKVFQKTNNNNNNNNKQEKDEEGETEEEPPHPQQQHHQEKEARGQETVVIHDKQKQKLTKQPTKKQKSKAPVATSPPQYKSLLQVKEWNVNSHDFPGALHFHFEQERLEPFFRKSHPVTVKSMTQRAEQLAIEAAALMVKKNAVLHPCNYYTANNNKLHSTPHPELRVKQECFETSHKHNGVLVYNTQSFPRIFCGKTIKPHKVQHITNKLCQHASTEPPRLLLESDNLLGTIRKDLKKLPPIVINRANSTAPVEAVKDCDVPCQMNMDTCLDENGKDTKGETCLPGVSNWTVEGTNFKFLYSMMDPRNAPTSIEVSRKAYRENQYYATRSFQSEIPLSTFDWSRYGELKNAPKNDFKKSAKKGMVFIHLEPCTGAIRPSSWASKLVDSFKGNFDYYGPCKFKGKMAAKDTKLDVNKYQDRQTIMSQYMFTLVIGVSIEPDIISELVWDALMAGSIPVYNGAPNIREHVPEHSILVASEYSSQETLAAYLDKVSASKATWEGLHAWRDDDKATSLMEEKYGFMKDKSSTSYCRMCRWALATKYSLGWNHQTQTIEKPSLDRKFCVSPKDELQFPVQEIWMSDMSMQKPSGRKVCDKFFAEQTISFDEISITRTITSHDNGVIDIAITDIKYARNPPVVLRLNFRGIHNVDGAHLQHPHQLLSNRDNPSDHVPLMSSITIQDDATRATVLANWVTDLTTANSEGLVDILVRDPKRSNHRSSEVVKAGKAGEQIPRLMEDEVLRIRIILEDVNHLRDATTEYNLTPYASLMISDFLEPLMFFQVAK